MFSRSAFLALSVLAALSILGCGKKHAAAGAAASASAAAAAPATASAAPAAMAAPKPSAQANAGNVLTPAKVAAQAKSLKGKRVEVKGYYFNYTSQGTQLNVSILPKPDIATKGPLCVFPSSAKAALDKVTQKSEITVSGVVDGEFFGQPKLKDCKLE